MANEEVHPHIKEHNNVQICFADTLTQATNALNRRHLQDPETEPAKLNQGHLMLFGVEEWKNANIQEFNRALGQDLNTFKRLEIFGCEIDEAVQRELANGLTGPNLQNVTQLDLDNTALTPAGATAIFTNVAEATAIETLNLQGSVANADVMKAIDNAMPAGVNIFRHLNKVDLKINDLKKEAGEALASLMTKFVVDDDVELDLFYNDLQAEGAQHIARGLQSDGCMITKLDLCCNNIGDAGAQSLAAALLTNDKLKVLKLALNNIGNPGAIALFHALVPPEEGVNVNQVPNTTLQVLDLSANVMKEEVKESPEEVKRNALMDQYEKEQREIHDRNEHTEEDKERLAFLAQELGKMKTEEQKSNRPLMDALINVLHGANHLKEIDFTGIETDDTGWAKLGSQLPFTAKPVGRPNGDKMKIKFSIVDLMSTERLKEMEKVIWGEDKDSVYDHIDWRRRDPVENKEEEKTN